MKPQRFEIGQAVTPKRRANWTSSTNTPPPPMDIFHVAEYWHGSEMTKRGANVDDDWYIRVEEYGPNIWAVESNYEPVISTKELYEQLQEVPLTQTV